MAFNNILRELEKLKDTQKAQHSERFFKTQKGEYGEGDKFLGITVPNQRKIAKKYKHTDFPSLKKLLYSPYHEHRLTGWLILTYKFEKSTPEEQKEIYEFTLTHRLQMNNWDLVDSTAHKIIGEYLREKPQKQKILYTLAHSKNLWEKRIAIMSTYQFIKHNEFTDTLKIATILLNDRHDLIHKAVGWMLREIGKKDQETEEEFLKKHYKTMPRTMLRYAIEKFSPEKRKFYMGKSPENPGRK